MITLTLNDVSISGNFGNPTLLKLSINDLERVFGLYGSSPGPYTSKVSCIIPVLGTSEESEVLIQRLYVVIATV